MINQRIRRVEETVKVEVAQIIQQEIKDPRVGFVTVSDVKVSKDLHNAIIFVSFLEDDEELNKKSLEALEKAKGFIRHELGKRIVLKYIPALSFKIDTSSRYAAHINEVLKSIKAGEY